MRPTSIEQDPRPLAPIDETAGRRRAELLKRGASQTITESCPCGVRGADGKRCVVGREQWQLACLRHWKMLPTDLQDRVWVAYRDDRAGSEHLGAIKACMEWWRANA